MHWLTDLHYIGCVFAFSHINRYIRLTFTFLHFLFTIVFYCIVLYSIVRLRFVNLLLNLWLIDWLYTCYIYRRSGLTLRNFYGRGSGPIWLDDLHCTGHEKSLAECAHRGWGVHYCGHRQDVSIVCSNSKYRQPSIRCILWHSLLRVQVSRSNAIAIDQRPLYLANALVTYLFYLRCWQRAYSGICQLTFMKHSHTFSYFANKS